MKIKKILYLSPTILGIITVPVIITSCSSFANSTNQSTLPNDSIPPLQSKPGENNEKENTSNLGTNDTNKPNVEVKYPQYENVGGSKTIVYAPRPNLPTRYFYTYSYTKNNKRIIKGLESHTPYWEFKLQLEKERKDIEDLYYGIFEIFDLIDLQIYKADPILLGRWISKNRYNGSKPIFNKFANVSFEYLGRQ